MPRRAAALRSRRSRERRYADLPVAKLTRASWSISPKPAVAERQPYLGAEESPRLCPPACHLRSSVFGLPSSVLQYSAFRLPASARSRSPLAASAFLLCQLLVDIVPSSPRSLPRLNPHPARVAVGPDLRHVHRLDLHRQCPKIPRCDRAHPEADLPRPRLQPIEEEHTLRIALLSVERPPLRALR